MKSIRNFVIILLASITALAYGQTTEYDNQKLFEITQLKSDFDILVSSLKEVHPAIYAYISEDELESIISDVRDNLTEPLNESDFHILVRKFIRSIRCGHTVARPSSGWYEQQANDSKILPFTVTLIENKIYIDESYYQDSILLPGIEILSINGRPSGKIIQEMRGIQQVDGFSTSFENKSIEKLFRTYHLFLYGRSDQYQLEFFSPQRGIQTIQVTAGLSKTKSVSEKNARPVIVKSSTSRFYMHPELKELGILEINGFSSKGYKKYYKTVFAEIEKRGVEHLVLDLRGNGGGYFPNGNLLLRYFIKEESSMDFSRSKGKIKKKPYLSLPFTSKLTKVAFSLMPDHDKEDPNRNYRISYKPKKKSAYDSNLYVLTDGGTFSMGSLVATKLRHQANCTIIGQETGGGEEGSNAILVYKLTLPSTAIRINIPLYHIDHGVEVVEKGRGVIPDYAVGYSLAEKLERKDKEIEIVQSLVR